MALLDAKEYDPRPAQRRKRIITIAVAVIVFPLAIWYFFFYYWPEEHVINKFFHALEQKDFDAAYGIYQGDPDWKQHPEKYPDYSVNRFTLDWGPAGEYGPIFSHHVDCSLKPKTNSSGVVVVVTINNRAEPRSMWVENKTKSISDSPVGKVVCHGQQ
ncbi:MAG: hypothetical protein WA738_16110 [Candidatus Angelobacter sp.]